MRSLLLLAVAFLFSLDLVAQTDFTTPYVQTVTFKSPKAKVESIIYGSKKIGFFESSAFKTAKGKIHFKFIPITYKENIIFRAKTKKKTFLLGRKKFKNPTPAAIQSLKPYYVKGKAPTKFIISSVSIPKAYFKKLNTSDVKPDLKRKNGNRFTFLIGLNQNLEIIWSFLPHRNGVPFYSYVSIRKIGMNQYGYVLGKKDGLYETIDIFGKKIHIIDGFQNSKKFPMHHDFAYIKPKHIVTFSNRYAKMKNLENKRKLFLSNTILSINLENKSVRKAFDFLHFYRPKTVGYWQENKFKARWVSWDTIKADHDFVHANSIEHYPGEGFLVSLKHLDKIVFIDSKMKKILWSVGPTKSDTFYAAGAARFAHQHDAKMVGPKGDRRLVLFDNGFTRKGTRILSLSLNKDLKRAEIDWEFDGNKKWYAENRGGVEQITSNVFAAHYVSPTGIVVKSKLTMDQDAIIFFDKNTKEIISEIHLPFRTRSAGYRSLFLDTLGSEKLLR